MEQRREPMNKNRIRGVRCGTSQRQVVKSTSIKSIKRKSGGCALKAVVLTSGGLYCVSNSRLRRPRDLLIVMQKSADGVVERGSRSTRLRHSPERGETDCGSVGPGTLSQRPERSPTEGLNGAASRSRN